MNKPPAFIMPVIPARSPLYRVLPAVAILSIIIAGIPPAAGDTITCPSGYTCTSCGGDLCIVCPSGYYCLSDDDASAQLGNFGKLYNWPCGYESGIDRVSKFCYREAVVNENPPVAKISPASAAGTAPYTASFSAAGSSSPDNRALAAYSWNFGDGTTGSGMAVTHTYANAGTYVPAVTVTDDRGKTGTARGTVTVTSAVTTKTTSHEVIGTTAAVSGSGTAGQLPQAVFTAYPNTGSAPLSVEFDGSRSAAAGGSIVSYAWDFGDGSTGTGTRTQHAYTGTGTYAAFLRVTDSAGLVSPAYYATISVVESPQPVTTVTRATDSPRITGLVSDPDYSSADFMQPGSKIEVIPREYKGSIVVDGGDLLIRGSAFGSRQGTVSLVLDKPIEAYSFDRPFAQLAASSLLSGDGKRVALTIVQWTDNTIRVRVEDIRANYRGGEATLYLTRDNGAAAPPYTCYLSPKWNDLSFSGYSFFNPSHNEDAIDGYTSKVIGNTLYVKHDPRCSWNKWSGDNGRDDFFRESLTLPPNVRFSEVSFRRLRGDVDWFSFAIHLAKMGYSVCTLNYYEIGKFVVAFFANVIDEKAGSYTAWDEDSRVTTDPSLLTYQREYMIFWENTCFGMSPYDNQDLSYAVVFRAWVPDGITLGA